MRSPGLVGILRLASLNAWLPQSREPRQANAPAMTILDTYTTSDSRPGQTDAPRSASRPPRRVLPHTNDCRCPPVSPAFSADLSWRAPCDTHCTAQCSAATGGDMWVLGNLAMVVMATVVAGWAAL